MYLQLNFGFFSWLIGFIESHSIRQIHISHRNLLELFNGYIVSVFLLVFISLSVLQICVSYAEDTVLWLCLGKASIFYLLGLQRHIHRPWHFVIRIHMLKVETIFCFYNRNEKLNAMRMVEKCIIYMLTKFNLKFNICRSHYIQQNKTRFIFQFLCNICRDGLFANLYSYIEFSQGIKIENRYITGQGTNKIPEKIKYFVATGKRTRTLDPTTIKMLHKSSCWTIWIVRGEA